VAKRFGANLVFRHYGFGIHFHFHRGLAIGHTLVERSLVLEDNDVATLNGRARLGCFDRLIGNRITERGCGLVTPHENHE